MLDRLKSNFTQQLVPDESHQIESFASAGLRWEQARRIADRTVASSRIPRTDPSNHYEIFAGISEVCTPTSILEIGTHRGVFTAFLAALWPAAKIVTYELPMKKDLSPPLSDVHDISRHYVPHFESDAEYRNAILLEFPNIQLRLQDSSLLTCSTEKFDVIWVDGDHCYPVVAFDIANSVRLCSPNGWVVVDDIRTRAPKQSASQMGSTESYESVRRIAGAGLADLHLVQKRKQSIKSAQELYGIKQIAILRKQ